MHAFQHVISGHSAVGSIKQALGIDAADFINMLDDLSLGPLGDVDVNPATERIEFWFEVWGDAELEAYFTHGLAEVSQAFRALPSDPRPCLVWFGTGANERMTLYRVAHALRDSPRKIWAAEAPMQGNKSAVGICNPQTLAAMYDARRLLSPSERREFASRWPTLCAESSTATLRHPTDGEIETRPISNYDPLILEAAQDKWLVSARVFGQVMQESKDAWPSDMFLYWRMRELARAGLLDMDKPEAAMRESRVRRIG